MEAQQEKTYGEGFRQGVTRLLAEVQKLGVLSPEVQEKVTLNAAKLCLAEAVAEQKAVELAGRAKEEWQKQEPKVTASLERLAKAAQSAAVEVEKAVRVIVKNFGPEQKAEGNAAASSTEPQDPSAAH